MTTVVRETKETKVRVELTRDGRAVDVSTTIPFLDHMLVTFARRTALPTPGGTPRARHPR